MSNKTAITNVRVFDGQRLREPGTVVIEGASIGDDTTGARLLDARGATLLPGLIDAHIHLHDRSTLDKLARYGITTGLDMATWPPQRLAALRDVAGLTDIRSAGTPAIGPTGPHSHIPGIPSDAVVHHPEQAKQFVATRLGEGSDYLKIILEAPGAGGPDEDTARALVTAAHAHDKQVVAHAASPGAFTLALDIGADIITHVPLGPPLASVLVARVATAGSVVVPTLTMMQGTATNLGKPEAFAGALGTVAALHRAGVLILAGTDANTAPGVPAHINHGESLHDELELLVRAGLSPASALRAATSATAQQFGLTDRGTISPGLRADLVLIDGDPTTDINATRNILRVWCAGVEQAIA